MGGAKLTEFKQALQDYVREECQAVLSQREALVELTRLGQEEEAWNNAKFEVKVEEPKQKPIVRCWEPTRGWYTMDADDFRRNNPGWFGFSCEYVTPDIAPELFPPDKLIDKQGNVWNRGKKVGNMGNYIYERKETVVRNLTIGYRKALEDGFKPA